MSPAFLLPNTFFQVLDVEANPQAPAAVRVRFTLGGGREKALTLAQLYQEVLTTPTLSLTTLNPSLTTHTLTLTTLNPTLPTFTLTLTRC